MTRAEMIEEPSLVGPVGLATIPFRSPNTLASRRADQLRDAVQQVTVAHDVQARRGEPDGLVITAAVGALDVVYVRYGASVLVDVYPTHSRFAMSVPLGAMRVSHSSPSQAETRDTGFVLSAEQRTLLEPDPVAGAVVISAPMSRLEEQLANLSGRPPATALRFLPPGRGPTVGPPGLLESSWRLVCRTLAELGGRSPSPLVARHLEQALLSSVLLTLPHNRTTDLLSGEVAVPRDLPERARQWLEQHYLEPITVTDLARAVNLSVRRLQDVFAHRFETTPTEMLRDIRLTHARQMLQDTTMSGYPTVAAVAHRCGFSHLSRFAIAYRQRFGESPSVTLRRVHGRVGLST